MSFIGNFPEDFTSVVCMFTTHHANGSVIAPSTAFEADDVRIYKNGNAAQKTTTNGVTMTSPFDSVTGLHCVVIDTSNDTGDGGFWVANALYTLVLIPDETVQSQTVVKVIGTFTLNASVSVASVSGAVGSVTGAVGSVTGSVGGNVTGSVGSVAGNVSGNVTGTIGGLTAAALKDFFDTDSTTTYGSAVAGSVVKEIADNAGGSSLTAEAIADEVWASSTRSLTVIDEDSTTLDLDATIRAAVGLASANLDTQLDALPTAAENATAVWGAGTRVLTALDEDTTTLDLDATIRAAVGLASANLDAQLDALPTAAENATAVWGAGTRSLTIIDEDSTTLDLDATIRAAVGLVSANLDTQLADLPTNAELATALGAADDAVLTAIDALPTNAELATALGTADDAVLAAIGALSIPSASAIADEVETRTLLADIRKVNNVAVDGAGTPGDPWGPA